MYEEVNFKHLQSRLRPGDLAYDVGAYDGQTPLLIAEAVGPENVVIIEPAEMNWPTIRAGWGPMPPRATFPGFMDITSKRGSEGFVCQRAWPPESALPLLTNDQLGFRWLHYLSVDPGVEARPRLSVDALAKLVGTPRALAIDVEGAELLVLQGARSTILTHHPLIWVSIHPAFMVERFNMSEVELHDYMFKLGYRSTLLLSQSHEDHWFFE